MARSRTRTRTAPKDDFEPGTAVRRLGDRHTIGTVVATDPTTGELSVDWPGGRSWHRPSALTAAEPVAEVPPEDGGPDGDDPGEGGDGPDA